MKNKVLARFFAVAMAATVSFGSVPAMNVLAANAGDAAETAAQTNESEEYTYLYAGLTWKEYWAAEDVYDAGDDTSVSERDSRPDEEELDKGAFDAVTRATTRHGLDRGSYQTLTTITAKDGKTYEVSNWKSGDNKEKILYTTDGKTATFAKGVLTFSDGTTAEFDHYTVSGLKYVPVKVKTADLNDFKAKYPTVDNGGTLAGGYTEKQLKDYSMIAAVDANTNGLKTATKQSDGSFTFSARATGTDSGVKATADATVESAKEATNLVGSEGVVADPATAEEFGAFVRLNFTGDGYADLGEKMQAVKWTYYGNDAGRTKALRSFGTKFAADNWMHSSMGIQLGLTNSLRCQLPEGTDGTGYWTVTIYGLGFKDYSYDFELKASDIVATTTTELENAVKTAEGLKEADYSSKTWNALQTELTKAQTVLSTSRELDAEGNITYVRTQAVVDDETAALNKAINALTLKNAPKATTIKTVKAGKKNIKVTWKKQSGVSGYQIQYATSKKFKSAKVKSASSKATSATISKLTSKKTYYVRIRTTKKVSGKTYTSKWSAVKSAKVK